MATQETQQLDNIISSRRAVMLGGGALATLMLAKSGVAETTTAVTDTDILNFALNLEYLEGEFYTLATTGQTLAAFGVGTGAGTTTAGSATVTTKSTTCKVPFALANVAAYALETAAEERLHVTFLRNALGAAAVTEPNIDLYNSFHALGGLVGVPTFDPFADDYQFLLGAYIFEDVGVSAYHGAATLITSSVVLTAAAKIHAVEAYHAGLVRTSIYTLDQAATNYPAGTLRALTEMISAKRATLDGTAATTPDDVGLGTTMVALNSSAPTYTGSTIVNADANSIGWARTTSQVLSIVYANPAAGTASGGFFPAGLNGTIKTV